MASDDLPPGIHRPIPRRTFELTPATPGTSAPATPASPDPEAYSENQLSPRQNGDASSGGLGNPTKSILNLTSSTLFGIYQPTTGIEDGKLSESEPPTPWGTGAETPSRRASYGLGIAGPRDDGLEAIEPKLLRVKSEQRAQRARRQGQRATRRRKKAPSFGDFAGVAARVIALFGLGVAYGVIVSQLHDQSGIAPVRVNAIVRTSYTYLGLWGAAGVALGSLLPWIDWIWENREDDWEEGEETDASEASRVSSSKGKEKAEQLGNDWHPVVRSIGAFVGIAFAIRKLHWQSTLQVSVTLAMVNPALWYLIDRSKPGFTLSALVGLAGTALLLLINPDWVPPPAAHEASYLNGTSGVRHGSGDDSDLLLGGLVSYESIGVATWIASVLFCSCVCFGNIGRRLAWSSSAKQ